LNQKEFYESDNEYSQIKSYDLYLLCTYLSVDINRQMEYTLYVNIYSNLNVKLSAICCVNFGFSFA
jgi:hypothetical protein